MNHLNRGKAIIMNNKYFRNGIKVREGTDKDASDLDECLSKLGFEVTRFDNLTAEGMRCKLREGDVLYIMIFNIGRIKYTWNFSWSFVLYLIVLSKIIFPLTYTHWENIIVEMTFIMHFIINKNVPLAVRNNISELNFNIEHV